MHNTFYKFGMFFLLLSLFFGPKSGKAQDTLVYKSTRSGEALRILAQKDNPYVPAKTITPAVLLLSGGGWVDFSWSQLKDLGKHFADWGAQVFIVEYRTSKAYPEASPLDALDDVHDAIFYMREQAATLQVDPKRIITVGASAGGHLAFASSLANPRKLAPFSRYQPNYIVAYSPVLRNDSKGYAYDRIGPENASWFSPWNVYMETEASLPPSIIFSGEVDPLIKINDLMSFTKKAAEKGDAMELISFKDIGHSMRNQLPDIYDKTSPQIMSFLTTNGLDFAPSSNRNLYFIAGLVIGLILFVVLVIRRRRQVKSREA